MEGTGRRGTGGWGCQLLRQLVLDKGRLGPPGLYRQGAAGALGAGDHLAGGGRVQAVAAASQQGAGALGSGSGSSSRGLEGPRSKRCPASAPTRCTANTRCAG